MTKIRSSLLMSREYIIKNVSEGDLVVDATAGNGWDTLLLAQCVGDSGKVLSFDVQEEALASTRKLLENERILHRVQLIHSGHEQMANHLDSDISAVMFNLGYLPGGDHSIVTRSETTILALETALKKLRSGGMVAIVIYSGHDGGKEEEGLLTYASHLKQEEFTVLCYKIVNQINKPPSLLVIEKVQAKGKV